MSEAHNPEQEHGRTCGTLEQHCDDHTYEPEFRGTLHDASVVHRNAHGESVPYRNHHTVEMITSATTMMR